jgi:AcrR family transcriptional regulator
MTKKRSRGQNPRRSREEWLEAALDILSRRAGTRIRVRDLSAELGVTTGSFYRHFSGREDFVRSVVTYWQHRSTTQLIEHVRGLAADPKARLIALTTGIIEGDLARYDVPVRTWATQEPGVAPLVRRVDNERLDILRDIFAALGFRGADLEMRSRTFVMHFGLEHFMHVRQSRHERLADARRLIELLMQPAAARAQRQRKGRGARN